jgi:hypothetical protein
MTEPARITWTEITWTEDGQPHSASWQVDNLPRWVDNIKPIG